MCRVTCRRVSSGRWSSNYLDWFCNISPASRPSKPRPAARCCGLLFYQYRPKKCIEWPCGTRDQRANRSRWATCRHTSISVISHCWVQHGKTKCDTLSSSVIEIHHSWLLALDWMATRIIGKIAAVNEGHFRGSCKMQWWQLPAAEFNAIPQHHDQVS